MSDIAFTQKDIEDAIDEINRDSGSTDLDIPAPILKDFKHELSYPIYLLCKKSSATGVIPKDQKIQSITGIFKKGDKSSPENYRPNSLTPHIIKIYERIVRKKLVQYLESNNILSRNQHGFRKGRSTLTHLLNHIDEILQSILDGQEHDVIYLDFAKAFDKVDHEILINKLKLCGIAGNLLCWITNFLENRYQFVNISGCRSFMALVLSGVPQGSVLGPILFLIYINDLEDCLQDSVSRSFADDTRLSKRISDYEDVKKLQLDLDNVVTWSHDNNMKLHEDKFELLTYRGSITNSKAYLDALPYSNDYMQYLTSDQGSIYPSSCVKDLGIYLSPDLSWSTHVNKVADSAKKIASWVLSVFSTRMPDVMLNLFKIMVRSKLEYCCPVWCPSHIPDIQKIESIQRSFTQYITGCQDLSYWDRLKKLDLLSLQRRRERYLIIHMWKIINGHAPNDISVKHYQHNRLGVKCRIPDLPNSAPRSAKTAYDHSFSVRGPQLWNILPREINSITSLDLFKRRMTQYIKDSYPDTPPVHGYTCANSNSLLDWAGLSASSLQQIA